MPLSTNDFEQGRREYRREIERRNEVSREREFEALADRYRSREPPHFQRSDLRFIFDWKYTDRRFRKRWLESLDETSDEYIRSRTGSFAVMEDARAASESQRGMIYGVGIAGVSAILAAARPRRFPVIDKFALLAVSHYYLNERWAVRCGFDKDGLPKYDWRTYPPYAEFCQARAVEMTRATRQDWTPRHIDMALWAIGKKLSNESKGPC